jgi:FkbM family methyltransferase
MIKRLARSVIPASTWAKLSGMRAEAEAVLDHGGPSVGVDIGVSHLLSRLHAFYPGRPDWIRELKLKAYRHPIYYRVGTSDIEVIRQVLLRREYDCVAREHDVSLIIDCGANIGCTSFFLLHCYPQAQVVVVEPDPGNFAMCRRNLEPFGDRAILINSGVWPTATPLRVARGCYGDGRAWSFQVRPSAAGEPYDLIGTTVLGLIERSKYHQIDILKIDIECGEIHLFSKNTHEWLPRTRCLAVELHGPDCERVFFEAVGPYDATFEKSGELTVWRNARAQEFAYQPQM